MKLHLERPAFETLLFDESDVCGIRAGILEKMTKIPSLLKS